MVSGALARAFAPVVSSFRLQPDFYINLDSDCWGGGGGGEGGGEGERQEQLFVKVKSKRKDEDSHEEAVLVAPVLVEVAPFPLLPVLLLRLVPLLVDATATFCP